MALLTSPLLDELLGIPQNPVPKSPTLGMLGVLGMLFLQAMLCPPSRWALLRGGRSCLRPPGQAETSGDLCGMGPNMDPSTASCDAVPPAHLSGLLRHSLGTQGRLLCTGCLKLNLGWQKGPTALSYARTGKLTPCPKTKEPDVPGRSPGSDRKPARGGYRRDRAPSAGL